MTLLLQCGCKPSRKFNPLKQLYLNLKEILRPCCLNNRDTVSIEQRKSCKKRVTEMSNTTEKIVDWFLNSRIWNGEAYVASYSPRGKALIYPEITAYAISLSCILYKEKKGKRFLDRAEACARYMMSISKDGGFPCFSDHLLYTFDTGIFISGIFDLYALTGIDAYLREAKKSLNWLYSYWDGKSFDAVNKIPEETAWYQLRSVHLAKLAIPLLKASKYLGEEEHRLTAFKLLDSLKRLQTANGAFKVNETSDIIMIHPHCYATEAYLYAYYFTQHNEFIEMVRKSSNWLCKVQNADGSFYQRYDLERTTSNGRKKEEMKTSDATAQATRIWKLLGVNQEGIEKAYQYLNSELKDGGLGLFKNSSFKSKLFSWRKSIYSWPTFFYLHSLILPFGKIENCENLF